jgi:hypothetical protein
MRGITGNDDLKIKFTQPTIKEAKIEIVSSVLRMKLKDVLLNDFWQKCKIKVSIKSVIKTISKNRNTIKRFKTLTKGKNPLFDITLRECLSKYSNNSDDYLNDHKNFIKENYLLSNFLDYKREWKNLVEGYLQYYK